jgi:indole-3-glycerol phosphate synthase
MNLIESIETVKRYGNRPVIAEIKRVIPKLADETGLPKDNRPAELLVRVYQKGGACGISLVTEKTHFGGEPEKDIPAVLMNTPLPLLIKDFILDKSTVDYYADLVSHPGKDNLRRVTLLLTAHLAGDKTPELLEYIHAKGMTALVETRTPADLKYLNGATPKIIGVNNKNIDELEKGEDRILVTHEILSEYRKITPGSVIVCQSAHRTPNDVRYSLESGADAVLVGTAFMTAADPEKAVASFVGAREAVR